MAGEDRDDTFCLVGQWRNFQSIVNARPEMIGLLDSMRDMLADLGGGLGVTDPVSGDAVVKIPGSQAGEAPRWRGAQDEGCEKARLAGEAQARGKKRAR
jgi:hypothetical protein